MQRELPLFVNLAEFLQQIVSRDSVVCEQKITIILRVIPNLRPDVSDLNSREGFVSVHVSNGYTKELNTAILTIKDQSRTHHSMCRVYTELTRPEFRRGDVWGVQDELIGRLVEGSSRFNPLFK